MAKWIVQAADYWQSKPDPSTGVIRERLNITAFKPTPTTEQGQHGHPPKTMAVDPSLLPVFKSFPGVYDLDLEPTTIWVDKKKQDGIKVAGAEFVAAITIGQAAPAASK